MPPVKANDIRALRIQENEKSNAGDLFTGVGFEQNTQSRVHDTL